MKIPPYICIINKNKKMRQEKVEVSVEFIKQAFKAACISWKEKLLNEFPHIDLHDGPTKGELRKSKTNSLVVYVTRNSFGNNFSGIVVIPNEKDGYPVGYVSNEWNTSKSELYTGEPINVAEILGIK